MTGGAGGRGRPAGGGGGAAGGRPGSGPAGPARPAARGVARGVTRPTIGRPAARPWSDEVLERLAVAYHQLYRDQSGHDGADTARLDWDELPEHLRESNRTTARALGRELAALGYEIRRATGDVRRVTALPPEHVQQLAEAEHSRWVREKLERGYVYGPVRRHDGARPTHPDLVAWGQLTPAARNKDRVRYLAAPRLLAALGYEIVRPGGLDT